MLSVDTSVMHTMQQRSSLYLVLLTLLCSSLSVEDFQTAHPSSIRIAAPIKNAVSCWFIPTTTTTRSRISRQHHHQREAAAENSPSNSFLEHFKIRRSNKASRQTANMASTSESSKLIHEEDEDGSSNTTNNRPKSILRTNMPLSRPHERVLFLFYYGVGLASTRVVDQLHTESILMLTWLSFVMAVSFMEAWVKFKAPLLRKHVAVDVGRHVFAALNAVELGLAGAFWTSRFLRASSSPPLFAGLATALLLLMVTTTGPMLFVRAKHKMVHEAGPPEQQTASEKAALKEIDREIRNQRLPHPKMHVVYVALEAVKVVCLSIFLCKLWAHSN